MCVHYLWTGCFRCHAYVLKEITIAGQNDFKVFDFDKVLFSHMGYFIFNQARAFFS